MFLATKMRNVGGIAQTEAQKSSDLFMKTQYLDELTGGRGVIFATGTPISNSMVELYTIQRYLQYGMLQEMGLVHFDDWAGNFGETVTAIELSPEGTGYRARTRFAKFYNLPELMAAFKGVADIQTADMLKLPVPKANFHTEVMKPSEIQKEMIKGLAERAEKIHAGGVDPHVDNMLRITNDGRKLALDMRLIQPLAPDDPNGKVAVCARNVYRIWEQTKEKRSAQLVFCDLSTPTTDGSFSVYGDLKKKLMDAGIPEEEIAFIHTADSEAKKKELFSKVRSGQVRVLLGSTAKMGAGTNVQDKLIALHDLDCPWRPSDLQQRLGRIVRQGNENEEVEIYRYVTEGTFDAYLYQLVENKQKFIAQIMTSKAPVRVADDVDETALSYSEIKALATGNPLIIEKCNLDMEVARLNMLKASHLNQVYALEELVYRKYPEEITRLTERIEGYEQDVALVTELTDMARNLMFSIDIVPVPTDEAVREVENRLLGVETNITNWQRRQNANNNFSAVVPYDMELQRKESKEFLDDLTTRDQRMMFAVMTLAITADTKEQLDSDTEAVLSVARKHMCQLAVLKFQQLDGLNTALPIGARKINAFRTLTTESLAVFIPFKVQEIQDKGGIYFGENAISHNLILCNKANLLNQSAFYLGVPGAGKSFAVKELIAFLMLHPDYADDDILICDPEGEFGALVKTLGREKATVAHLVAGGKDRLNAMYMVEGYGENNPIVEKSQFVMSLIEQIDKRGVGPQHKSIIDRCTALVYPEAEKAGRAATLCDLRRKLLEQPEDKAKEIALSLELYTTGSLDIFGRESTVDLSKPYVVFDIHGLGEQLKPAGSLVITDTILNRVTLNWKRGKRTHVFIDEFHVMFENEQSGIFFNSAWRQFRKRGAYPTAITQNVEYLLDSVQASTMLSNSEFLVMLSQAASDRAKLAKLLNISNEQMSYVTNADAGCGLIRYGSALVPFINRFPRDTRLYALMTTKPGEGVFGGEEVPA